MSMLFDPMIKWPEIPTVLSSVQYFISDGIIIYGGVKGPFKLNGKNAINDTIFLIEKLKRNNLKYTELINKFSELPNANNLLYVLIKLHQNGFLSDKKATTSEQKYYDYFNQNVKNYSTLEEIKAKKNSFKIKIETKNLKLKSKLKEMFLSEDFIVTDETDYDWCLMQIKEKNDICYINESKKTLLFAAVTDGLILGPIVADNALKIVKLNYLQDLDYHEKFTEENIYNIYLTMMKTVLKLKEFNLDRGLLEYRNYEVNYVDLIEIIGEENLNTIDKYEITSAFSAPYYQNKSNHLAHYREGNVRLSKKEFVSDFWKETDHTSPKNMLKLFTFLGGFKKVNNTKKYSPTGGNINSNIIFYVNMKDDDLDGIGIYYFDNIKNKMFQVDNSVSNVKKAFRINSSALGYIILGNNVDYIETKYHDFSFKIANLNIGVQLATLMALKNSLNLNNVRIINNFDENYIQNAIGAPLNKLIFNIVVEVR